jgi:hypothetical protein
LIYTTKFAVGLSYAIFVGKSGIYGGGSWS